jgi:hypothetical protein
MLCIAATCSITGCASIGPATVSRDRFDYVASISDSWKRQMLQNLLKVRYADAPVFLDVTSVISGYSFAGQVDAAAQAAPVNRGDTFAGIGGKLAYADRPTITYAPLSGEKFSRSLMSPLPISGILYLVQSGYPADLALRACVNSINGLTNAYGGRGSGHGGDPRFAELMVALRRSQIAFGLVVRQKSWLDRDSALLYLRPTSDESRAANQRIRELLDLDPDRKEYEVNDGTFLSSSSSQVTILTRSTLQVLADFSSYIEVPESDIAEGRVGRPPRSAEQQRLFEPLIRIHSGDTAPADAYVAMRYRGRQFWIDDRDLPSKSAMTFLMLIFSLAETGNTAAATPQVTVPAR